MSGDGQMSNSFSNQHPTHGWVIIHQTLLTHQKRKKKKEKEKEKLAALVTTLVGNCNIEFEY
jgi:hypothetical protein